MNWLLITVIVIFLISIIVGTYRGAIKIAVSLVTALVTYIVVFLATPYIAKLITDFTPLDDVIKNQVSNAITDIATNELVGEAGNGLTEEGVRKALKAAGVDEEMLEQYNITIEDIVNGKINKSELAKYGISGSVLDGMVSGQRAAQDAIEDAEIPRDVQMAAIQDADIPDVFKKLLAENNNSEIYEQLGVKTFAQYVGSFLAKLFINIVTFLCTFILVTIVIRAIVFALDIVADLPGVGALNHLAGGLIGAVGALLIVWTLYLLVTLMFSTAIGKELFRMIQESDFLDTLYKYNPVMKLATIFR